MWVCRLPVHIGPAGCTAFTEILGEFVTSHWADRVVGPYGEASMHTYPVGADDSVRPQTAPVFTGIYGESVAAQRADVGIGPYMTPANSCCPANFECKAEKMGPPEARRKRPRRNEPPRYARSLLSSASVSSFPKRKASLVCVLGAGLDGTRADPHSGIFSPCITPVFALEATSAPTTWPSLTRSVA